MLEIAGIEALFREVKEECFLTGGEGGKSLFCSMHSSVSFKQDEALLCLKPGENLLPCWSAVLLQL